MKKIGRWCPRELREVSMDLDAGWLLWRALGNLSVPRCGWYWWRSPAGTPPLSLELISGVATCSLMLAPLFSSTAVGVVKIQPIPTVAESDFHAASILQRITMFNCEVVSTGGSLLGVLEVGGNWAFSHSFARKIALLNVSRGDGGLFWKSSWLREYQIDQHS